MIMRALKGLDKFIPVSVVHWLMRDNGWNFQPGPAVIADPIGNADFMYQVYLRADLPGGEKRLYADAIGVQRVLVNGVTTVVDGEAVDALPGIVLRSGRDTRTVVPSGA